MEERTYFIEYTAPTLAPRNVQLKSYRRWLRIQMPAGLTAEERTMFVDRTLNQLLFPPASHQDECAHCQLSWEEKNASGLERFQCHTTHVHELPDLQLITQASIAAAQTKNSQACSEEQQRLARKRKTEQEMHAEMAEAYRRIRRKYEESEPA